MNSHNYQKHYSWIKGSFNRIINNNLIFGGDFNDDNYQEMNLWIKGDRNRFEDNNRIE